MMNRLGPYLRPGRTVLLTRTAKEDVLEEMFSVICTGPEITDPGAFREAILEREAIMSTGIGQGIAVPHAKIAAVDRLVIAAGVSRDPVEFGSIDNEPVHFVVMIGAPADQQKLYLQCLARVVLVLKNPSVREALLGADDSNAVYDVLKNY